MKYTTSKKITELLPIRDYVEGEGFILEGGGNFDIIQLRCKDLFNISKTETDEDIARYMSLYKTYPGDLKIIAMNYPSDTKVQQEYCAYKIAKTPNERYKDFLKEKFLELSEMEKNDTDREFYLVYYCKNKEDHKDKTIKICSILGDLAILVDKGKKLRVLYKYNNKNSSIFV